MAELRRWRKRRGLTQVDAAALLGVSQPYLSLLEEGVRPLTAELRLRMRSPGGPAEQGQVDHFRAQLSSLGYPGFAHVAKPRVRPRPGAVLMAILAKPDVDARVVEALPWLATTFKYDFDFVPMVRQAKLQNLQNRLGFLFQLAGVDTPEGQQAVRELEQSRLLQEGTLCWDSMPAATREWMRANRSQLAAHWNVLTRLGAEDLYSAA